MTQLLPSGPLSSSASPVSSTHDMVNVDELADRIAQYHRQRGGLSIRCMVLSVIISDLIILGLLVGLYYILYSSAPGAIIPNAGLRDIYLNDLNVADFTINATTMASLRTDLAFQLVSNRGFNISSQQGTDIIFSTQAGNAGMFTDIPSGKWSL